MTQTTTAEIRPPYPRLGELYRALAGALDTKARDRVVDRLAREGENDWSLLPTLRETLVTNPLRDASDHDFAELVAQFVDHVHASYLHVVANVPLDSLNRGDALPLLVEHYFAPHGTGLLLGIKQAFGGPDLMALLDPEKHPLAVVLDCFDKAGGRDLAKAAFPGSTGTDRSDRELIARWASGAQLPDLQSIKRFVRALSDSGDVTMKEQTLNLRYWLLVGRALAWLENESLQPFRAFMRRHLLLGLPDIDIGRVLSLANIKAGERFSVLTMPALMLYEDLKRTTPKAPGEQARTKDGLDTFRRLCETHDPEGRTRFHLAWLLGRWHALCGQFSDALPYYEEAANLANYRAGDQQKQIVEETLVLAAFVGGKKPLLKTLKHRAIVFGLFTDPRGGDVIEDWEIDHLRQQFHRIFPRQGRFPEAPNLEGDHEHLPFLMLDEDELAQLEPDLRKPDRVRTVHALDGQKRRWPQLRLFASVGRFDAVHALLEHGASVDQLDEAGGSALLCAIQHAEDGGDRRALDLLLAHAHMRATLDSATTRKRHTPLICAVRYGEPDVVERLLAMGATPDRRGQVDEVTPLYRSLSNLGAIRKPTRFRQYLRQSLLADPDHVRREMLRRYNVSMGGVFGDERTLRDLLLTPQHRAIFEKLEAATVKEEFGRLSEPNLLRIVELLLKAGANPNAAHEYPTPGRTPLMLAAEDDSADAFDLMMRRGGNPYQQDAQGLDCVRIAIGFRSRNVVEYMRKIGIL
ncbi:ankyrin repeat domain-containing protein [Aromatoleum evansii]|uniref:Ankyrin repeat domain-containing protein n=1 Tax=Aromatoleum evansii TaxID=59406 RepID=A0ABZ1AHF1_AROEV|nr:ankyrin repeat domain-containing protein [Aromatoleum evansii]